MAVFCVKRMREVRDDEPRLDAIARNQYRNSNDTIHYKMKEPRSNSTPLSSARTTTSCGYLPVRGGDSELKEVETGQQSNLVMQRFEIMIPK
jgi:hypothetical protein